jgi:hypothetical protein
VKVADLVKDYSKIGLFGTPTVHLALKEEFKSESILYDINPFLSQGRLTFDSNYIQCDLNRQHIARQNFDVAVLDPPWYSKYYINWIAQAINNLNSDGSLFITKIPSLTRNTVMSEWEDITNIFKKYIEEVPCNIKVEYETPEFERETLVRSGIENIGNWRTTELRRFILKNKEQIEIKTFGDSGWKRYKFGKRIVNLKIANDKFMNVNTDAPYPDGTYILRSVSRRHQIRNEINLLTSHNRCMIVKGTNKIDRFLSSLSNTNNLKESIESFYSEDEVVHLKKIFNLIYS